MGNDHRRIHLALHLERLYASGLMARSRAVATQLKVKVYFVPRRWASMYAGEAGNIVVAGFLTNTLTYLSSYPGKHETLIQCWFNVSGLMGCHVDLHRANYH